MVVVATQDHMSNPSPAMEFAGILHAPVVQLTGECGHLETGCDKAVAAPKVREFIGVRAGTLFRDLTPNDICYG